MIKELPHLRFVTRRGTQDLTENHTYEDAIAHLAALIPSDYLSATLFTRREDVSLVYSKKRIPRLTRARPSLETAPSSQHNRQKAYLVDTHAPYLAHLGVTQTGGVVKPSMYAKFRQICRFVEILDQLLAASKLKEASAPRIVDVGSGKGYLTFALHEHLSRKRRQAPVTRGIEANAGLVASCNEIAAKCKMAGLTFEATKAEAHAPGALDVLIALHACDTATDDAIHLGIAGGAEVIVCAPCCQHEVAPQLADEWDAAGGLAQVRIVEAAPGRSRHRCRPCALLLEAAGYEVRIIEFISDEHTSKNLMITGVRSDKVDRAEARAQYERLVEFAGVERLKLAGLMMPPV